MKYEMMRADIIKAEQFRQAEMMKSEILRPDMLKLDHMRDYIRPAVMKDFFKEMKQSSKATSIKWNLFCCVNDPLISHALAIFNVNGSC